METRVHIRSINNKRKKKKKSSVHLSTLEDNKVSYGRPLMTDEIFFVGQCKIADFMHIYEFEMFCSKKQFCDILFVLRFQPKPKKNIHLLIFISHESKIRFYSV